MLRLLAMVVAAGLLLGGATASSGGDHAAVSAALKDVQAAIDEIVDAEDLTVASPIPYHRAAHRAINDLVGVGDRSYDRASGAAGDDQGAIGHVDRLLHRTAVEPWTSTLDGVKANLLGAVSSLQDALGERQLENYQLDVTTALADLEMALGRASQIGVLGGLEGAYSTTVLGVPPGARVVSACAPPTTAPSYGIVHGRLAFVALPLRPQSMTLGPNLGVERVEIESDRVVLYTAAAGESARLCRQIADVGPPVQPPSKGTPRLYTAAQARAGKAVFDAKCVQCHGANLQGTAAPAVAGTAFLKTAQADKWTVQSLRSIVVDDMPFNDPGSLTPGEYADVLAFLLASSCYPAGAAPFPQRGEAKLAGIPVTAPAGRHPDDPKLGTCAVK